MSRYCYSPLSSPDSIRLLRLIPAGEGTAEIQCELLEYSLRDPGKGTHLYEALSYVWGSSETPRSISVNKQNLAITENLHAALLRLRDRSFERIIWVDSICINQVDTPEKERQIQSMAKIYGRANRVIVCLGEAADNSDQALEDIRIAADDESTSSSDSKKTQQAILKLLERPWFRRIWVLQEVAAARRILIMCGPTEINGHAFGSGINKLELSYEAHPDLQSLIRSMTYLIRGAIFRPKYATSLSCGLSFGELTDMYHTREATVPNDKVYALLGMSSDYPIAAGLSPDYAVPWKTLLQRLTKFVLSKEASIETWDKKEIVVIKGKGCILGQVSSVERDRDRSNRERVNVVFNNTYWSSEYEREHGTRWVLRASAKPIRQGDFVCLLLGASKPTIIRPCKDHFTIIVVAVSLQRYERTETVYIKRQESLASTKSFSRDFLLVWNWEKSPENLQNRVGYETSLEIDTLVPGYLETASNKAAGLCDVALALGDSKRYRGGEKRVQGAIEICEEALGKENLRTLAGMDCLALIYKSQQQWTKAKDLFLQLIQTRKRVQGIHHQDTLSSIANLVSTYMDQSYSSFRAWEKEKTKEVIRSLAGRIRDNLQIREEDVVQVVRSFGEEIIILLLDLKRDNVLVTKSVVEAAAKNRRNGKEVMSLLLDRFGAEVQITEEVVKAAVENSGSGKEVLKLLLDQRGAEVQITEEVLKVAAKNDNKEVVKLLLDERGAEVQITEEVLKEAAGNWGKEVMKLLLDERGAECHITEEVLKEVAGHYYRDDEEMISLFLDQHAAEIQITADVAKAAVNSKVGDGRKFILLLLDRCSNRIVVTPQLVQAFAQSFDASALEILLTRYSEKAQITDEVIKAAAGNYYSGKEVMSLLLDQHGVEVQITEEVVKAAAGNGGTGRKVMSLLLDRHSNRIVVTPQLVQEFVKSFDASALEILLTQYSEKVQITEEVIKAAAENSYSGKEVMSLLLDQHSTRVRITEKVVVAAAQNSRGKELMALLLDRYGAEIQITEKVVKAAVGGGSWSSSELMTLIFDQRGGEVQITEGVLKVVAGSTYGEELMTLLLDRHDTKVHITEEVVKAAAGGFHGKEVMTVLLDRCGAETQITEEVFKTAAGNIHESKEIMKLLLENSDAEVQITEDVAKAVAENGDNGKEVMSLLLDWRGATVQITEEVVKAVARNKRGGKFMSLLLDRRGSEVQITEEVVKAAAGNERSGIEVTELLLDRGGAEVQITEEVVKAAAGNEGSGGEVMKLLLDQRGAEVQISEKVLKEAVSNRRKGYEIVQLLHQTVGIKITTGVIEAAATSGQEQVLSLLDQWNAFGSDKGKWLGISRLYNAAERGDVATVRRLVAEGIPPDKRDIRGTTPLWRASESGYKEVVDVLLATSAVDVNVRSTAGQTPLFRAAARGRPEVVRSLLDHGAEPNHADKDGRSPLSVAQFDNQATIISMLTRHTSMAQTSE